MSDKTIPAEEVEELIDEWKESGKKMRTTPEGTQARVGRGEAIEWCAKRLEELIEEHADE